MPNLLRVLTAVFNGKPNDKSFITFLSSIDAAAQILIAQRNNLSVQALIVNQFIFEVKMSEDELKNSGIIEVMEHFLSRQIAADIYSAKNKYSDLESVITLYRDIVEQNGFEKFARSIRENGDLLDHLLFDTFKDDALRNVTSYLTKEWNQVLSLSSKIFDLRLSDDANLIEKVAG